MDSNTLKHHGVKGMKWGVRRARKQYYQEQKHKMRSMSDAELRREINRIRMEEEYTKLTKKPPNPVLKFASDVLLQSGKNIATDYVTKYGKQLINDGINKYGSTTKK